MGRFTDGYYKFIAAQINRDIKKATEKLLKIRYASVDELIKHDIEGLRRRNVAAFQRDAVKYYEKTNAN